MRSAYKYLLSITIFYFWLSLGYSQKTAPLVQDCFNAPVIKAQGRYSFEESPQGIGEKIEFSGNLSNSLQYFKKENNSAWFQLDVVTDGILVFKIVPKDTATDFDFLLFRYTDENFCSDIIKKRIKPLRTNISRYKPEEKSITGLSTGATEERVHSGPGSHYSKAIDVVHGERYYLVLDNVYGNQAGFTLVFAYYNTIEIRGVVKNDQDEILTEEVKVSWESLSGEVLAETIADKNTGEYKLEAPVAKTAGRKNYRLTVESANHFFIEKTVRITSETFPDPINIILPELKKGKYSVLKSINFYGGSPKPLPTAKSSLKRLYKLMKSNDSLEVRIDGHAHGCVEGSFMKLSEDRAETVKRYLVERGIEESRITTKGFGCTMMLFPHGTTTEEMMLNRRVEILVTGS